MQRAEQEMVLMDFDHIYAESGDIYALANRRVRPDTGDVIAWQNRLTAHQFRSFFTWIDRYAPPGASVLDWGCGAGMLSYYLIQAGFAVQALDMVPPLLVTELEQASHSYQFTLASEPKKLPYADASLDIVLSMGVLEHVRETGGDELTSLLEIHRILKADGFLFAAICLIGRVGLTGPHAGEATAITMSSATLSRTSCA
jgi:2-polyprenyl-3-methyl-5-hydroxy-6-metoxy-1,4-benzoquinol methylase